MHPWLLATSGSEGSSRGNAINAYDDVAVQSRMPLNTLNRFRNMDPSDHFHFTALYTEINITELWSEHSRCGRGYAPEPLFSKFVPLVANPHVERTNLGFVLLKSPAMINSPRGWMFCSSLMILYRSIKASFTLAPGGMHDKYASKSRVLAPSVVNINAHASSLCFDWATFFKIMHLPFYNFVIPFNLTKCL